VHAERRVGLVVYRFVMRFARSREPRRASRRPVRHALSAFTPSATSGCSSTGSSRAELVHAERHVALFVDRFVTRFARSRLALRRASRDRFVTR
ncbi:MAG: hypothetical protein MUC96_22805, partial [Myxococcaceae bacterium]|nr:hypothetical protein [Myxococcaceae bacterium]